MQLFRPLPQGGLTPGRRWLFRPTQNRRRLHG